MSNRFEHAIETVESDIDRQGHVNNVAFLRYVQDAAVAHWHRFVSLAPSREVTWVVRRHEIEYFRPGLPNDQLVAHTWVGEPSGATWERFTEITRRADGQILVKARTVWVQLDLATLRPKRIDPELVKSFKEIGSEQKPS